MLDSANPRTGQIRGARLRDTLTGDEWDVKAKGVINATGPFCDGVRKLDDPTVENIVAPSSGVHITLPKYYSPGKMGLIDPNTSDGRVIFFLPWEGNAIAGTTDTAETSVPMSPKPREEEVEWILGEIRNYISPDMKVRRGDVLSAWSGIRPLVRHPDATDSKSLVRNHMIHVSEAGLLTISGGKWTTYRNMAKETIDRAVAHFGLSPERDCVTAEIRLLGSHGWHPNIHVKLIQQYGLDTIVAEHLCKTYGDQAWTVCALAEPTGQRWPIHGRRLDPSYPYIDAEVRYACRRTYACTATDIIARRTRLSFLNSQAALDVLPQVVDIMAVELGWDDDEKVRQFDGARDFLADSMGLPESKAKLSLDDVRTGKARSLEARDPATSRAIFGSGACAGPPPSK
jgi:glycerol-3-phosphate dehydrogenase